MAEETPNPIEAELDPKVVEAELAKVREARPEQPSPPDGSDPITDAVDGKVPETAPAEAKPAETKPPAEPEKKPERTEAEVQREGTLRRLLREREKELAELRAEKARQQPTDAPVKPKEPTYEEDPAEFLKRKIEATEQTLAQERQERAYNDRLQNIRNQEAEFERGHPDYKKALRYLEESEVAEWEESGAADSDMAQLADAVRAGRNGDGRYKGYSDHIDRLASNPAVQDMAEKQGKTADDIAVYLAARDTYMAPRRMRVWQGAEKTGKNAAEIAYNLAKRRGYKVEEPPKTEDTARAQVERQREISRATESLSESSTTEGGAGPKVIRSRNDIIHASDDELDAIIGSDAYRRI